MSLSAAPGITLLKAYAVPFLAEVENLTPNEAKSRLLASVPEFGNPFERSDHLRALAIRKEDFCAKLVHLNDYNYLDTLRNKLSWGLDRRN